MGQTFGINTLMEHKFQTWPLSQKWINAIGPVERNFKMIVWGRSGSGKTTYVMQLCGELAQHGKVYFNSVEQRKSKSLQDVVSRCGLQSIKPGRIMFGDADTYEEMLDKIKKLKAAFVVIDSLDYLGLTIQQFKDMIKMFPRKAFIIISWEGSGEQPKSEHGKSIRYMSCIKTYVKNGRATSDSRFGATEPYTVFTKKAKKETLELGGLFNAQPETDQTT